jgi:excisionase family DNA binding protein
MNDYLTPTEVASELGLPKSAVYAMLHSTPTPFPVVKSGRNFRIARVDLERYIAEGARESTIDLDALRRVVREEIIATLDPAFLRHDLRARLLLTA